MCCCCCTGGGLAPARSLGSPPRLWWAWYDTQPPACLPACLPACPHYLLYVGCLAANICCPASNGTHSPISLVKAPPSPPPLRVATGLWRRCDRLLSIAMAAGRGVRRYHVREGRLRARPSLLRPAGPQRPSDARCSSGKESIFFSLSLLRRRFSGGKTAASWLDRLGTNMLVLFN